MNDEVKTENAAPLGTMSVEQLRAELARREQEEKKARSKAITDFNTEKDAFLSETVEFFKDTQETLKELKSRTILQANEFYSRMYEMEDKKPKEVKSFTLKDEEDKFKVIVDRQERLEFTQQAEVHINAIKDIFKAKFESRNKGMYNLIDSLLIKGNKGDYDPRLLAKARKAIKELGDEALISEFYKLEECQRVVGSALYCRCYYRDDNKKWQEVSLQFSGL